MGQVVVETEIVCAPPPAISVAGVELRVTVFASPMLHPKRART